MTSIKFSAQASASAASSITVPFGGTPAVGDLVLVFLLVDNEIITHQPGWASEFTNAPNPWFEIDSLRAPDSSTLSGWYHTWNASDSGTSAQFTFVPAPTLGIGDKDLPSANAVAVAVVLDGTSHTALLEHNIYGINQDLSSVITASPMKKPGYMFHAVATTGSQQPILDSDGSSTLIQGVGGTGGTGQTMGVYQRTNPPVPYAPTFTLLDPPNNLMVLAASVSDALPQIYNPPYIEEGPMGDNRLMYRYRINRFFTVFNNTGTFVARRYPSTDDVAAATQVFTNNQPISSTDRTNILNAGVGGDFRALS